MQQASGYDETAGVAADDAAFVLDAFGAADYELNLATGALRGSQRLNALYGYPAGRPLTLADCQARFHPTDRDAIEAAVAGALAGEPRFQREFRLLLPDGAVRWVLSRGEVVRDAAGQPALVRGVAFDISERKQDEAKYRDTQTDPRADGSAYAALGIRAFVTVPFHRDGTWMYYLAITDSRPREWRDDELQLIEELSNRIFPRLERARAEAALRESESQLRLALDLAELGTWTWDLATGGGELDPRAATIVGLPPGGFANAAEAQRLRVHPDDLARLKRDVAVGIAAGDVFSIAYRAIHPDGSIHHIISRGRVLADEAGRPAQLVGINRDVTAKWAADAALRESEERYRTLLDSIDQGFCLFEMLYDADDTPVDYRFLKVNRTFERHTGLRDAVGRTARELVPELEPHWVMTYAQVAATGEPLRFEQGSAAMGRWFEVEAVRVGEAGSRQVALIFTDVTARKQADADEHFLSELSEQLRVSDDADQLLDAVAQQLGRHLQVERCFFSEIDDEHDHWTTRHGYSQAPNLPSLTGNHALSAFPPRMLEPLRAGRSVSSDDTALDERAAPFYEPVYQPLGIRAFATVPLRHNGRWVADLTLTAGAPYSWTSREISLLETVAERVWNAAEKLRLAAAQRAAAARLQQLYAKEQAARAQAEEASRLKDEFLATVSHELRTPLTAFLGYAELLQRRKRDEAYVTRTVEKMVQSARAQAALIEDLLDVSRIVSGKLHIEPEPIALSDVVQAALDTVRPTVEAKDLQLQLDLDPAASPVLGDAGRLQQVVWNLLSNATKFTPPGGRVAVRLAVAGGSAELSVSDSGLGIQPDFLPFVFDRFRQADSSSQRAFGGLGLGLAIVRHLVELHGGTVEATSGGVGQGATFTVRLPLARGSAPASQPHAAAAGDDAAEAEAPRLHGLRVLVVDDQPAILELLKELLSSYGATARGCTTAQEALALVRAWQPDLLVSDIAMPDEDGYWLIQQVRGLASNEGGATPAVALTAYVRMEDRLRVLAAGYQQYLPKPVNAAELRDVIMRLFAEGHAT